MPAGHALALLLAASLPWAVAAPGRSFLSDDYTFVETWGRPPWSAALGWFGREYTGFYRPVSAVYWKLVDQLSGGEPLGYHAVQHLLHVANALLLWRVARTLHPTRPEVALGAALLFLYAPGHALAVLMPAAVPGLLCSFFLLLALLLDAHRRVPLGLLSFGLALLTKELAVAFPVLVFVSRAAQAAGSGRDRARAALVGAAPYVLVLVGYVGLRILLFGGLAHSPLLHSNTQPLRLALNAGIYTATAVAPWSLEDLKPLFRARPQAALAALGLAALAAAAALSRLRRGLTAGDAVGAGLLLVAIAPVARLYSPWNAYLPAAAIALLLASVLCRVRLGRALLAAWVCLGAAYAVVFAQTWREAGRVAESLLASIDNERAHDPSPITLANLPVELDGVPVFGGDWGLDSALRLRGSDPVAAIGCVHQARSAEPIEAVADGEDLVLSLPSPEAFFRLQIPAVLNHQERPRIGMAYRRGCWTVAVERLNRQGEAGAVRLSCARPEERQALRVWTGDRLIAPLN